MMRRITGKVLILVTFAVLWLSGCGKEGKETEELSFYDRGLEIVQMMWELTSSQEYRSVMTDNEELQTMIEDIGSGDYSVPEAVYSISVSREDLEGLASMTGEETWNSMSEEMKEFMMRRIFASFASQINGIGGATKLAASSICAVEKTFVNETAEEDMIYLYTFQNGIPIAVTFLIGEDHAVNGNGMFVLYDAFPSGSEKEIGEFFAGMGIQADVKTVTQHR